MLRGLESVGDISPGMPPDEKSHTHLLFEVEYGAENFHFGISIT